MLSKGRLFHDLCQVFHAELFILAQEPLCEAVAAKDSAGIPLRCGRRRWTDSRSRRGQGRQVHTRTTEETDEQTCSQTAASVGHGRRTGGDPWGGRAGWQTRNPHGSTETAAMLPLVPIRPTTSRAGRPGSDAAHRRLHPRCSRPRCTALRGIRPDALFF